MRVLYVNHTGMMSGAERSLLALLTGLPPAVSPAVACPDGQFAEAARSLVVPVYRLRGMAGSLKLHPWHTAQAVADVARAAVVLAQMTRRLGVELVHANSIRAGVIASLAARFGGAPTVIHVRDCLPSSRVTDAIRMLIGREATAVICNSYYTEANFTRPGFSAAARVVYNPVDLARFDPDAIDREEARRRLGLEPSTVAMAVIAQLTPWKAQDDAVRIVRWLKERHPDVRLLLVGSAKFVSGATRYDNRAHVRSLERLIDDLGVRGQVQLLGEREDVPEILRALDLVLVPSWEEPFGRAVAEGMAMGVPVAATAVGGPGELLADGREGLLLPPREPGAWATALEPLIEQRELREAMGKAARERAVRELSLERHVEQVLSVYREALAHR
jgi:glycosyltransferase involved in cell wall biosynthesis